MHPSAKTVSLPAMIALTGSLSFSVLMLITRHLRATSDVVMASSQFVGTFLLGGLRTNAVDKIVRIRRVPRRQRINGDIMNRFRPSSLPAVAFTIVVSFLCMHRAAGQEIGLTPMQATEVARGYRASALELKQVVNEKGETVGRINDFIFGKDGNNYVILAVGDYTGLSGELVAVPFKNLKLDDPSGNIVLPGASRAVLERLPVFVSKR